MFSSEVQHEDVVIQVVCREVSIEQTHRQSSHLTDDGIVRIPINNSDLIPLSKAVWIVVGESRDRTIALIHDTRIFHYQAGRRLEIYVWSTETLQKRLQLKPWGHCKHSPTSELDEGSALQHLLLSTEPPPNEYTEWQRSFRRRTHPQQY